MTIKQSAVFIAIMATITLTGAGCLSNSRGQTPAARPVEVTTKEQMKAEASIPTTVPARDVDESWVRYKSATTGQIGMSFLYPSELTPVVWDTTAWGTDSVGIDFGGFGIARIPNANRLTISEWLKMNYPDFSFNLSVVNSDDAFYPALSNGTCEAYYVMDDFDDELGLSGIGGTVFMNVGDTSLYTFTLAQDWNQELGDRVEVIRTIMSTIEWFTERSSCATIIPLQDDRTGISFEIPAAYAPVYAQEEYGIGHEETFETTPWTCLTNRTIHSRFNDMETLFLTINDTWECEVPGRDGYWGDQARLFTNEDDIEQWCQTKDSCESFTNAQGIQIWYAYTKSVDDWGDILSDIDEYAAFNPNKSIGGILFSNQGFVKNNLGRQQQTLRTIVDSLTFTN